MSTYNKIVLNGQTLIDLSNDTVDSSDDIVEGLVGHLNNGTSVTGTASGGGGGSASDPVRFLDYDGTVLYSYSASEFASLTELPPNPSHVGLTAQGWNWTLADAQTYVTTYRYLDIGQMYITDDGKTRIYISLMHPSRLSPYLGINVAGPTSTTDGSVEVDWGDGTSTTTVTGKSLSTLKRARHTYATIGDYVITLTPASNSSFAIGGLSTSSYLLNLTTESSTANRLFLGAIRKIELGTSVSLNSYALYYCSSLESITIPNGVNISKYTFGYCSSLKFVTIPSGVTSLGAGCFKNCTALLCVSIPSGVSSLGDEAFYVCFSLSRIALPNGVTTIGTSALYYLVSLANITFPSSVTSIGTNACNGTMSLGEVRVLAETPPALSGGAFGGLVSDCVFYVPAASLTAYQEGTNWATFASQMIGE